MAARCYAEIDSHAARAVGMLWCLEIEFHAGRPRRAAPTVRPMLFNCIDDLFDCTFGFGHGAEHPIVDHAFVFTVIDFDTLRLGIVPQFTTIRIQNIARADEQRDRREVF